MLNVPGARLIGVAETRARQVSRVGQYMFRLFVFFFLLFVSPKTGRR
jgi:hypothetical protein